MGQPLRRPATIFTYADYRDWPDDERWELIDGEAYAMAAPGSGPSDGGRRTVPANR